MATELVESEPKNVVWMCDLAVLHGKLGDVAKKKGDLPDAERHYLSGEKIYRELAGINPGNAVGQRGLFVAYMNLATVKPWGSAESLSWWRKTYGQLAGMKEQGILLPTDEKFLDYAKEKVGL